MTDANDPHTAGLRQAAATSAAGDSALDSETLDAEAYEEEALGATAHGKLFEADTGDLDVPARRALTGLLAKPSVSAVGEPDLFQLVLKHEAELRRDLNNLGLALTVSQRYGVAWAAQAPVEGQSPLYVLKRQMRLRRDQTVLLINLRSRQHAAETSGEQQWFCDRADLVDEVADVLYPDTKDRAGATERVERAIDDLEGMGYVRKVKSSADRLQIMPVLPASIPLERALEMLDELRALSGEPADANVDAEAARHADDVLAPSDQEEP
jgi:hypothetical protein